MVHHCASELVPAHEQDVVEATDPTTDVPTTSDRPAAAADSCETTTDIDRIDLALVHRWLSPLWAAPRCPETVTRAAQGSVELAALAPDGEQVADARTVTDHATTCAPWDWLASSSPPSTRTTSAAASRRGPRRVVAGRPVLMRW